MPPRTQRLARLDRVSIPRRTLSQTPRFVHSSSRRNVSAAPIPPASSSEHILHSSPSPKSQSPLARLPTSSVLRSYLITRMSSNPALLSLCFTILRRMLDSKSYLMSIDRNPVLAKLLKSTFYAQFCAGENKNEVKMNTTAAREALGYDGIILEYALEVLGGGPKEIPEEETMKEIEVWRRGMLESVEVAREGDFIGLKWSGLGRHALQLLQSQSPATPAMWSAITSACDAAAAKNVALLPGAEEESTNPGLDLWTLALQKKYNKPSSGRAIIYSTYQCYLKSTPAKLAAHLAKAQQEGYIAGVKLVRGAYLASEPRELIWATKEETDKCYDACAEAVLKRQWTSAIAPPSTTSSQPFPDVNIVLATHNLASVQLAQSIRASQLSSTSSSSPTSLPRLTYAQLQGMADEISQELVQAPTTKLDTNAKVVKCMTWGTTSECLNFLLRRASENKEAALRTEDTRRAMGLELFRRFRGVFGMA